MLNVFKFVTWNTVRNSKTWEEITTSDSYMLAMKLCSSYRDHAICEFLHNEYNKPVSQVTLSKKHGFLERQLVRSLYSDFEGDTIIIDKKDIYGQN